MEICSVFLTKNFQLQFVLEVTANLFSKDKGKMVITHAAVSIFFLNSSNSKHCLVFFRFPTGVGRPPPCRNTGEGVCPPSVTAFLHVLRCTILFPLTIHVLVSALGDLLKMY